MDILTFLACIFVAGILAGAAIFIALIWKGTRTPKTSVLQDIVDLNKKDDKSNEEIEKELNEDHERVVAMDAVIQSANELMGIQTEEKGDK